MKNLSQNELEQITKKNAEFIAKWTRKNRKNETIKTIKNVKGKD